MTAFAFDRIFKPGEHEAWHFVHSAGKCGEKILLAPATRAHAQQAGRSPVARQSIEVFAFYIYLVQCIPVISGVSGLAPTCMRKKRKMAIINFENFSRPVNILQWVATLKFVRIRPNLCAENIYSASPPCFVPFLSKNKWSSTIYNFWDWQNSDLHSACSLPPAKINIQTKIIFKSTLVQININMLSGKLFDF